MLLVTFSKPHSVALGSAFFRFRFHYFQPCLVILFLLLIHSSSECEPLTSSLLLRMCHSLAGSAFYPKKPLRSRVSCVP